MPGQGDEWRVVLWKFKRKKCARDPLGEGERFVLMMRPKRQRNGNPVSARLRSPSGGTRIRRPLPVHCHTSSAGSPRPTSCPLQKSPWGRILILKGQDPPVLRSARPLEGGRMMCQMSIERPGKGGFAAVGGRREIPDTQEPGLLLLPVV